MKSPESIQSKSQLAIRLSRLAVFENPKLLKEQYSTDSEAAAEAVWFAYMRGDIEGKSVADLGCGTGLLGIAALLLGAKKACFVDSDADALKICERNIADAGVENGVVVHSGVKDFPEDVDTVVQNPPFGTKERHADREFLTNAFRIADVVYSFHKAVTASFVRKAAADNGFIVTNILPLQLQLKRTYAFHKSRMKRVETGLFRMEKAKGETI